MERSNELSSRLVVRWKITPGLSGHGECETLERRSGRQVDKHREYRATLVGNKQPMVQLTSY